LTGHKRRAVRRRPAGAPDPVPIEPPSARGDGGDALHKAWQDLPRGLLHVHSRLDLNTGEALEALSLITPEALDEATRATM